MKLYDQGTVEKNTKTTMYIENALMGRSFEWLSVCTGISNYSLSMKKSNDSYWSEDDLKKIDEALFMPELSDVLIEICKIFKEDVYKIKRVSRKTENIVRCQRIFYYVASLVTTATDYELVAIFGKKAHSTAVYHRKKVRKFFRDKDVYFLQDWNKYVSKSKIWKEYVKK